jgi:hypothetical protein
MNALFRPATIMARTSHRLLLVVLAGVALIAIVSGCASLPWAKGDTGPSGPATITGQVTDDRGAILSDATVRLSGPAVRRRVTTNTAGRFTFERVPLGRYVVTASAAGFKNAKQTVQVDKETTMKVDLRLPM